ncbi:MAG: 50S ribosomal protein L18e [Candidatus Diapherotrites archaeon]|uniref:50S ribosomal protein L18e n=1 Tax=Candidatus Iainarchaeum sp. TaxID=3101447 RepID=A0A7J4IZG3_9ARCH|nr:MAG: 50S ribosomal protein L18e, large subunit ribosomal protein L18e [archaeon GW2011_AR10]MBS3059713.1 50S ribosomal protein L18e [Candidatus Diapherotrites archaeon]HIH08356.1 50S ribosomal protein L18e [Candidatus Diapherotrites archaeon]
MKPTGPSNESTRRLAVGLEKYGKKNNAGIFVDLSRRLNKPRRNRAKVNLFKLSLLGKKFGEKKLVVPGKVLGTGKLSAALDVYALEFSESAKSKIIEIKGKAKSLKELLDGKVNAKDLVIVV